MKKALFLFLFITITSCTILQEKGIAFKITNSSNAPITAIKISTSENLESVSFDSIGENKSREGFLSMKNNKSDGSYTLTYTHSDGSIKSVGDGYYTNGGSMDGFIHFEIQNDTTLVKFGKFPN